VATKVKEADRHSPLGLSEDDLMAMYRTVVTARLCDEAQFRLNRQGRAPFVVPVSGHEACQVGTAWPLIKGKDIFVPYYRDMAVCLVAGVTPQRWNEWMGRFDRSRVMLRMPRFRFDYSLQMRGPLERMGMGIAFLPYLADFQRIAPVDDLHISRVKHKSFIDVHELGTEAAAATAVVISVTSMPPLLSFDRPFIFAIRERSSGALLFVGRVGDPSAS
jgi:hypothetical protein